MEAIMKNKHAKVFVVFLGAALLLSPLVMLISCKQLHKTPAPPISLILHLKIRNRETLIPIRPILHR